MGARERDRRLGEGPGAGRGYRHLGEGRKRGQMPRRGDGRGDGCLGEGTGAWEKDGRPGPPSKGDRSS